MRQATQQEMGRVLEANMWQGRRWASVALSGLVAASLWLAASGRADAASGAGTEVLKWQVRGSVEAGGMYEFGENSSSKFSDYRDMDSGFIGELFLQAEKKDQPYYFDLRAKNPARDDQLYEGEFGRFGTFRLDLGWDRVRHVISNTASTIFKEDRGDFTIPASLRNTITTTPAGFVNGVAANCGAAVSWTCPFPVGSNTAPTVNNAQFIFIRDTITGLSRPLDYGFNTDFGNAGFRFTPREDLLFGLEYTNRRKEGYRTMSADLPNHPVEIPVPVEDMTHEIKYVMEFARPNYAIQFGYLGSFYDNEFASYRWDSLDSTITQIGLVNAAGTATRTGASARGELSAPPDNYSHTFNLTGTAALPFRSRINGTFAYTMLRQDDGFQNNVPVAGVGITPKNTDDAGRSSADAKTDLVLANFSLTSRPINSLTVNAKYRYFELQNDMPVHIFSDTISPITPTGVLYQQANGRVTYATGATSFAAGTSRNERYTKQNAGFDLGWRPIRKVSFKAGYEYEHWNRADIDDKSFSTDEHTAKAAMDVTPLDWLLGRVTYTYGSRYNTDYGSVDPLSGVGFFKFNYADRDRNRVDLLLQLSRWETFTPSMNFGYAYDNYHHSKFGLTDDENLSAGVSMGWTPVSRLTLSADYTYERHDTTQGVPGSTIGGSVNDFESTSKDEFHIINLGGIVDVIPKVFDINFGYTVSFGYTTIKTNNLNANTAQVTGRFDKIQNVLQAFRIVGRYFLTEKLSLRGGFAYERYNERNFAKDPMQPFMGYYDPSSGGIMANWVGATVPNYEAYIFSGVVRYDF
jgi:MtrB/PioB family decaheme-associated outer membrane protein